MICTFNFLYPPLVLTLFSRAYSKDFFVIHTHMASAGARAYNGGMGAEPPAGVQGAQLPVGGRGRAKPP